MEPRPPAAAAPIQLPHRRGDRCSSAGRRQSDSSSDVNLRPLRCCGHRLQAEEQL
jgi:hypothetical protein